MSKRWLTSSGAGTRKKCVVFLPDDKQMRASFFGAFLLLCDQKNWEEFGTMTPEESALEFINCWLLTNPPGGNVEEI